LTGCYSKFLTSYAHAYLTYLSRTSCTHRIHQPIPFLSPWACTLGLLTAYTLESRVGWAPARRERTNELTNLTELTKDLQFLPHDAMLAWYMLWPLALCLSVHLTNA